MNIGQTKLEQRTQSFSFLDFITSPFQLHCNDLKARRQFSLLNEFPIQVNSQWHMHCINSQMSCLLLLCKHGSLTRQTYSIKSFKSAEREDLKHIGNAAGNGRNCFFPPNTTLNHCTVKINGSPSHFPPVFHCFDSNMWVVVQQSDPHK